MVKQTLAEFNGNPPQCRHLILLLPLAGSLQFRNFTFNYRKKARKKSRKRSNIVQLADGVTALAQLYALYSHRARSFNQ